MSASTDKKTSPSSCCVCLNTKYTGGVILTDDKNMLELFEFCIGITINLNCLTKIVCGLCSESIKHLANFKLKCLETSELWQSLDENVSSCQTKNSKMEVKEELLKYNYPENEYFNNDNDQECSNKLFHCDYQNINDKSMLDYTASINKLGSDNNTTDSEVKLQNNNEVYVFEGGNIMQNVLKNFQCKKCMKEYSKHKWLLRHMRYTCYKDKNKEFKINGSTIKDLKTQDSDSKISLSMSNCGLCNIPNICDITKHMDEHWSNNDLNCQYCEYSGRDFADMISHSFQHCPKMKLFCYICKRKKASLLSLQFHFRSVHLQKTGGICTVCNKTFKKFKTWKRHERLHNENSLFICDHCGRKFLYKHEIKLHLIHHTGVRQFVCEICGKGFKRMSGLKDHIVNIHSTNDPVKCDHCHKTYKSRSKLEVHLKNIAKDKPFICEVCTKSFISEKVLEKHMFWHTGERPYSCDVCGSKYKAKGQLNLHMRNHTGFMPHKCVDCGKSFPAAKQLKRHQSVHTGVRAHKCVHCERSFHEKKALLEHAQQHKKSETIQPET